MSNDFILLLVLGPLRIGRAGFGDHPLEQRVAGELAEPAFELLAGERLNFSGAQLEFLGRIARGLGVGQPAGLEKVLEQIQPHRSDALRVPRAQAGKRELPECAADPGVFSACD